MRSDFAAAKRFAGNRRAVLIQINKYCRYRRQFFDGQRTRVVGRRPVWPSIIERKMELGPEISHVPLRCDLCGGTMKLERSEPCLGPHPKWLTYRCRQCGHIVTIPAEDER
jgi:hypothetical protein